jgi:hypothetical protein
MYKFLGFLWRMDYKKPVRTWHKHNYVKLPAGWFGTAPSHRRGWAQSAAQLFLLKRLCSDNSDHRFLLFMITTMTSLPPAPRTVTLLPGLLLYIINSLAVDEAVVCLHQSTQPTWPQLCAFMSSVFCPF